MQLKKAISNVKTVECLIQVIQHRIKEEEEFNMGGLVTPTITTSGNCIMRIEKCKR